MEALKEANLYLDNNYNLNHYLTIESIESIIGRTKNNLMGDIDLYSYEDLEELEQEKELDLIIEINDYIRDY